MSRRTVSAIEEKLKAEIEEAQEEMRGKQSEVSGMLSYIGGLKQALRIVEADPDPNGDEG